MLSAITISLVKEARKGPFVFHDGLDDGFAKAAKLGFDAVEIFAPSADAIDVSQIQSLCQKYELAVAAVGTGAGAVLHGLALIDEDDSKRREANQFIEDIIRKGAELNAPAILGSMQGRIASDSQRDQSMNWLAESIRKFGALAQESNVPFLIEPLNRYESNVFNQVGQTASWMHENQCENVLVLADLFHMNIEEVCMSEAISSNAADIGHVHFADSNRWAVGNGHSDIAGAVSALKESGYAGYLSAEVFALPDSDTAAAKTIESFKKLTQ